jgi:flagellar basal-body rod modification protein FlgD
MISSVTSSSTSTASAAMKESMGLDKDDFLKLFITQMQNQDPLNPMDSTEYIGQLAQLTQLEQSYNTNSNLKDIVSSLGAASAMSAVSFLGTEVSAAGSEIALQAGEAAQIRYTVPVDAVQVSVKIMDASGATVRSLTQGQTQAGDAVVAWDGTDAAGTQLPTGTYTVAVTATRATGSTFTCDTTVRGTVTGVDFSGSEPVLSLGGVKVSLGNILSVGG